MGRAHKICACTRCPLHPTGCPRVVPAGTTRCPDCQRQSDIARGTTTARGYGALHQQARARALVGYQPDQPCVRCGLPLGPDPSSLDLDHSEDRCRYRGLAHATCNRAAGGRGTA